MDHPFFDNRRFFIPYFVVWLLLLVAHSYLLTAIGGWTWKTALTVSVVMDGIFIMLSFLSWYPLQGMYANSSSRVTLIINWLVFTFLLLPVWLILAYPLAMAVLPGMKGIMPLVSGTMLWHVVAGFILAVITLMVYYLILSEEELKEKTLREAEMKALMTETELQSLKNQLNPHFLFNALNNIGNLILHKPENAREMLVKLSEYLRNVLDYEKREFSTVREEMLQIRLYLDLEKIRFEDQWELQEVSEEGCEDHPIPVMILQPLFENAVRYAGYKNGGKGFIRFSCEQHNDVVEIILVNSFDPAARMPEGKGIGLKNIRKRLFLIYRREDLLQISRKEDIFEVHLTIPPAPGAV